MSTILSSRFENILDLFYTLCLLLSIIECGMMFEKTSLGIFTGLNRKMTIFSSSFTWYAGSNSFG